MIGILLRTAIIGLGIWVAAWLIPGISTASTGALIWGAIALGLINAFVRPILVVLTLPVTVLTLGLFLLVLNAAMLNLAGWFVDGFQVDGVWSSISLARILPNIAGIVPQRVGSVVDVVSLVLGATNQTINIGGVLNVKVAALKGVF